MGMNERQSHWQDTNRLTVVVGHFGSGKTEFSVNLAFLLANKHRTALADLDIVDPYFRSRECAKLFEQKGIRLITSSQACMDADVPSLPPDVMTLFDDQTTYGVLDIGGDASGARVLARYRKELTSCSARILCIINANRPLTNTPQKAEAYIQSIEYASGLKINGLVNNTHLCNQTELEDILVGAKQAYEVSDSTGIPVICHVAPKQIASAAEKHLSSVFPIDLFMKKPWE